MQIGRECKSMRVTLVPPALHVVPTPRIAADTIKILKGMDIRRLNRHRPRRDGGPYSRLGDRF